MLSYFFHLQLPEQSLTHSRPSKVEKKGRKEREGRIRKRKSKK
jgi:hypothetical protein